MQVVALSIWTNNNQEYAGRVKNEEGMAISGIRKKVYKHTTDVQFLNNGNILATYKFPNVEIPFKSPMHSWENLWFCGGFSVTDENGKWIYKDDALLEAVLNAKKPMGYVEAKDEFLEKAKNFPHHIKHIRNDVFIKWKNETMVFERTELGVANKGTFGELFDLEAFIKSYQLMEQNYHTHLLTESMVNQIRNLKNETLSEYLHAYDYTNPRSDYEVILTGLILGFPLESTFALLTGNIK